MKNKKSGTQSSSGGTMQETDSVAKLGEAVQRLGIALGADSASSSPTPTPTTASSASAISKPVANGVSKKDEFQRPDMTAEEKKAQRLAKAAEKKAKAEAAAAKKAQAQNQPKEQNQKSGKSANQSETSKKPDSTTSIQEISDGQDKKSSLKQNHTPGKTKEVQFDLSANSSISSEDILNSAPSIIAVPAVFENLSLAHPAFLGFLSRCESESDDYLIDSVDILCQEFLKTVLEFLHDWSPPESESLNSALETILQIQLKALTSEGKWPLPFALENIVNMLRKEIKTFKTIEELKNWIGDLIEQNYVLAYRDISDHLKAKVHQKTKILTFDWCPLVNAVLCDVLDSDKQRNSANVISVVDVDMNGKAIRHVKEFIKRGRRCQYADLQSIGAVIQDCSMVVLGCSAVFSNGTVVASKGAVQIALVAKHFNVPLLVLAQTFKFIDRVQCHSRSALLGRESVENVPADLITAIVTEMRILPTTSVPAVLKAKALDFE